MKSAIFKKLVTGCVLYEANESLKKVVPWVVCNIYINSDTVETVVVVMSVELGYKYMSPSVVCCWHDTIEEAQECLEEMLL